MPFIFWEAFSIVYYGFPFPNTAYAKLGGDIDRFELIRLGWGYFTRVFKDDTITILMIFAPFLALGWYRKQDLLLGLASITLYCIYLLWIGGDYFWKGRFFTPIFLLGVLLFLQSINVRNALQLAFILAVFLIPTFFQTGSVPVLFVLKNTKDSFILNPGDEDNSMFGKYMRRSSALVNWRPNRIMPCYIARKRGDKYKELSGKSTQVVTLKAVGMFGFFAGPRVYIIDKLGLGDPLMARLPAIYAPRVYPGHLERYVPPGYEKTIRTNENHIEDAQLAEFYNHLKLITQGPLFSWNRLLTIIKMNLGYYDHLIDKDKWKFPNITILREEDLKKGIFNNGGIKVDNPCSGIEIQFSELQHTHLIKFKSSVEECHYHILLYNRNNLIQKAEVNKGGLKNSYFHYNIPEKKRIQGFDKIRIIGFILVPSTIDFFKNVTWDLLDFRLE